VRPTGSIEGAAVTEQLKLTLADVDDLLKDPSPDTRARTAAKVATQFDDGDLSADERRIAEEIFRVMVQDAEARVRRALSEHLKRSPDVPRDVAVKLAEDVVEVAAPMLEFSEVLSDEDLLRIVRSRPPEHQLAVAKRRTVSAVVADALADSGSEDVVSTLMANEGADIAEPTFDKVIDRFGDSERVNESIVRRTKVPISVAERLVTLVSDTLRQQLVARHDLPADLAADLVLQSRERATVGLLSEGADRMDSLELVDQLYRNGRLTSTIILRALCTGDTDFFDAALAKLAGIPIANAHVLARDRGELGLKALYEKCRLPPRMYTFFRVAMDVAQETDYDGGPHDRERYRHRMIERVLTHFEDGFDRESIDYLIAKLGEGAEGEPSYAY